MTCSTGEKISDVNVNLLCGKDVALISRIGMSAIGIFFAIIIIISIIKQSNHIFYYIRTNILRRKIGPIDALEIKLDAAKQFDLFISYAHQDEEFVSGTLLPKLENEFKQKVCVHSRDWTVGDLITDQIITSVERSRRTIIILTEHFLTSEWAYLEFHTAHNLSIQEGRPRVILILLDEVITSNELLTKELKSYITINTYLLWTDPNFWAKLQKILPKKIK